METEKKTILIVDDVLVNRTILCRIFKDSYNVEEAPDGEKALEILRKKNVSVVLLDLIMPVMDGHEVMAQMAADEKLSDIPIIVITASEDEESLIKVLDAGAMDIISKPFNPRMVRARVKNVLMNKETQRLSAESALLKQRIEQNEEALRLAEIDSLTGLYTRDAFCRKARSLIDKMPSGYYTISCFDIDNFKVVNEQYGIELGDRVLKYIAEYLKKLMKAANTVSARLSADNFAFLFPPDMDYNIAEASAGITEKFTKENARVNLQFSSGRYLVEDKTLSVSGMLDRALLAKASVKGMYDVSRAYYNDSMLESLFAEQWVTGEMEEAIAKHQFEAWFQPQYNHKTGAMVGAETLVRWRHPEKGLVSPGLFIPIFERNGFIYELDKFVWEEACRYIRLWIDGGVTPPPISVNASRYDIFRTDFVSVITSLIEKYHVPTNLFRVEITESAFAKSTNQIVDTVIKLQEFGLLVEIDDFGSGYSSFNTLKDVPADVLKIDMRFLKGDTNLSRGGSILESIVRMTRRINMDVIAEGVEAKEQADYLLSIGCSDIQGYLYARPMPADELKVLLKSSVIADDSFLHNFERDIAKGEFWDPSSLETLVFNRYTSAACVFEFCKGKLEILRANDRYARAFGTSGKEYKDSLSSDPMALVDESEAEKMMEVIKKAVKTGEQQSVELKLRGGLFDKRTENVRITVSLIAEADDRHLFYAYAENISEQRNLENQIQLINDVFDIMTAQPDGETSINAGLSVLLDFFDGDEIFIAETDEQGKEILGATVLNSKTGFCESVSTSLPEISGCFKILKNGGVISVDDIFALEEGSVEKVYLNSIGAKTFAAVPLVNQNRQNGILGVVSPQKNIRNIQNLMSVGNIFSVFFRQKSEKSRVENNDTLYV